MFPHWLHRHHRRMRAHRNFAVRFAYWNFLINSIFAVVWAIPVMALIFLDPPLASSVKWVSFLSVWALLATHAGGAIAAYAAIHAAEDNARSRRGTDTEPPTVTTDGGDW